MSQSVKYQPTPTTLHLVVTGMTCGGCEHAVRRALGKIDGVVDVAVSHTSNRVDVTFDSGKVLPAALVSALEALGYDVESPSP